MKRQRFARVGHALVIAGLGLAVGATSAVASPARHAAAHQGGTLKLLYQGAFGSMPIRTSTTPCRAGRSSRRRWTASSTSRRRREPPRTPSSPISPSRFPSRPRAGRRGSSSSARASSSRTARCVKASDVRRPFQRIFKVHGPTAESFYGSIVGAAACIKAAATCTLKGGVTADDAKGTVTFHLTKPDGEWLQQLAVPLASVDPGRDTAEGSGRQVGARHGAVHDQVVRPEPHDHARAEPVLQGVVEGRAARGVPRHDHRALRPHGRGGGHAGRERPGRLDRLLDPVRPPQRDRARSIPSSSS